MKKYLAAASMLVLFFAGALQARELGDSLKSLPVQDGGRIKPFNTFAKETLHFIYGRESFEVTAADPNDPNKTQKVSKEATEIVFTWFLVPEHWMDVPFFEVRHSGLKEALGLTEDERKQKSYFTPKEILSNPRLPLLIQELNSKRESKEKLNPYFQAIQSLEDKLSLFKMIQAGAGFRVMPPKPDAGNDGWLPVSDLTGEAENKFKVLSNAFVAGVASTMRSEKGSDEVNKAYDVLDEAVKDFKNLARSVNPEHYSNEDHIKLEIHLKDFNPFGWAWKIYVLALIFAFAANTTRKAKYFRITQGLIVTGAIFHIYGMAIRCILLQRPPVGNMYETVIWVPLVGLIFAAWLEYRKQTGLLYICSCVISILCLVISDLAPVVLDPSLQPLEPVLRDNFWLLIHVLVIVSSYAAYFLAFILGDIGMVYYLLDEKKYANQIKDSVLGIYRAIQIGVVLLASGIIMGGVWADYSWGRFWGWDPKETWALIALLGYIAVLHGRLTGMIKDFGMVVTAVVTFSLVIMSWYGVNFVLGAGLHTYGFGAGGVEYVSGFVALHFIFVVYVITSRQSRMKSLKS